MSTLRELRKYASSLGIKRYSRMTKSQLEAEIAKITDNSQHEKPQTCSIPDTTNITPADDTQEDTQNAQPETAHDDLPLRIVRAKGVSDIQNILRTLNQSQLKAFAQNEEIKLTRGISKSAVGSVK